MFIKNENILFCFVIFVLIFDLSIKNIIEISACQELIINFKKYNIDIKATNLTAYEILILGQSGFSISNTLWSHPTSNANFQD